MGRPQSDETPEGRPSAYLRTPSDGFADGSSEARLQQGLRAELDRARLAWGAALLRADVAAEEGDGAEGLRALEEQDGVLEDLQARLDHLVGLATAERATSAPAVATPTDPVTASAEVVGAHPLRERERSRPGSLAGTLAGAAAVIALLISGVPSIAPGVTPVARTTNDGSPSEHRSDAGDDRYLDEGASDSIPHGFQPSQRDLPERAPTTRTDATPSSPTGSQPASGGLPDAPEPELPALPVVLPVDVPPLPEPPDIGIPQPPSDDLDLPADEPERSWPPPPAASSGETDADAGGDAVPDLG